MLKSSAGALAARQFNSVVAENHMKAELIHPQEETFLWSDADFIVGFAEQHGMKVRGHNLVWHFQTPTWFFKEGATPAAKKKVQERLQRHIQTVVSRYKGRVYCWDVVNEAVSDAPNEYLRQSPWRTHLGEDYVELAFRYAHEADPKAKLFYNDYNTWQPAKREKILKLLKILKDDGVPVHGVGMQGHWRIGSPTRKQIEETIDLFASLGLEVQITELDVSVYSNDKAPQKEFDAETSKRLADYYQMCFEVFRSRKEALTGVTFWGIADNSTWLDYFPRKGRKNYPLLFDSDLRPKEAFWRVVKF